VIGWTTFGSALAPVVLLVAGLLLAGSSSDLSDAIAADPIGALATVLPTWYLVPFVVVAVLGLVGGAVLDIYSSGLALLAAGLRMPVGHRRRRVGRSAPLAADLLAWEEDVRHRGSLDLLGPSTKAALGERNG
jgi:purine-cytosine permease-like protein